MQVVRTSWPRPMAEPLMQLPHSITNPSQLQWTQLFVDIPGRLASNPIAQAANWLRAVGRSSTRWRNSSRRTNFTVCVTLVFPTSRNDRLASVHCLAS